MNKKIKLFMLIITIVSFSTSSVFASILGSNQNSGWNIQMSDTSYLHKNVFMSDQNGVGAQTEYFLEYTPDQNIRPVVVNGSDIFGKRNIKQAMEYMTNNGMHPLVGINADFFSFTTGVPMGHTIINSEVVTKDSTGQDAIGFKSDGSAFISWLEIETIIYAGDQAIYVDNVNKYRQPGAFPAFLLTDKFAENTKASTWGIDIVLGEIDSPLKLGGETRAVVESVAYNDGSIPIPEGKFVLTMDVKGYAPIYEQLQTLYVGQEVVIKNNALYDSERWNSVESGIGSIGGRLINNGIVNSKFEAGSAPRTAVGVTNEGKIIFYVLDGRQTGYSYGAKISTIAKRMAELGCVDAINLDGGGSTSMAGIYPGCDTVSVINSPSEGGLRSVANFIFLQNTQQPTGQAKKFYMYLPDNNIYLNGMTYKVDVKAVDTNGHTMAPSSDINYSITTTSSTISEDGTITFWGDGEVGIKAQSGIAEGYGNMTTYSTPTDIIVKIQETGEQISSLSVNPGEKFDMTAVAYYWDRVLLSNDWDYKWELIEGDIGRIDENGVYIASDIPGISGKIKISAGDYQKIIDVTIKDVDSDVKYPKVSIENENETIKAKITSVGSIYAGDVILKVDGVDMKGNEGITKTQIDQYNAIVEYTPDSGFFAGAHKISVIATNVYGYTGICSLTFGENAKIDFVDISNHWARGTIAYMSDMNIINGVVENNKKYFKPDNCMTRAEFAVMMSNYLKVNSSDYENKALVFSDNKDIPKWAENHIKAMYEMGIINGKLNGSQLSFTPNDNITRAEVITVLSRILPSGLYSANLSYTDTDTIASWAQVGFKSMSGAGFISGYEDGSIRPQNNTTRAEALKMLNNIM